MVMASLAQEIDYIATKLLYNYGNIPLSESNSVCFQPMQRKDSTSSIEILKNAWRRAGILAACKKVVMDKCSLAMHNK